MAVSYEKLRKLLTDRNIKRKDLMALSGVSQSSITKTGHSGNANTEVLARIGLALQRDIGNIAEIILPEEKRA